MPNSTNPQPTPTNPSVQYGPVFARYLAGALRQSLEQVTAHRYTVPDDVRVQAWHILRLTLDVDALWEQTSQLLIELAPRMEMAGFRQDWIPFLEAGIGRSEVLEDRLSQASQLYYLGQLYRMMGQYNQASVYLLKSESIYLALGEENGQALVLNERAHMAFEQGKYPTTKILAKRALELFDERHSERAMSHYHLGHLAEEYFELTEARKHYKTALNIRYSHDDKRWIAGGLRNLGIIYTAEKRHDKAINSFEKAIQIHNTLSDPAREINTLISFGIVLHDTKRYDDAIACYLDAKRICEQLSSPDSLAMIYNNLGMTYKEMRRWQDAIESANFSIKLRGHTQNPFKLANAMDTLGEIYMDKNEYQDALNVYGEALKLIQNLPDASSTKIYKQLSARAQELKKILQTRV